MAEGLNDSIEGCTCLFLPDHHSLRTVPWLSPRVRAVHLLGSIVGARNFAAPALYCSFVLQPRSPHWNLLSGAGQGQTHAVEAAVSAVRCLSLFAEACVTPTVRGAGRRQRACRVGAPDRRLLLVRERCRLAAHPCGGQSATCLSAAVAPSRISCPCGLACRVMPGEHG
jgi:hypothetical protein